MPFFVRSWKGRSSSRRLRSGSRSARKGSRDRNASVMSRKMLFKTAGFVYGGRHGPSNPCFADHRSAAQCATRCDRAADVDPPRSVAGADHPASGGGAEPRGDGAPRRGQSTGGGAVGGALHAGPAGRPWPCPGAPPPARHRARPHARGTSTRSDIRSRRTQPRPNRKRWSVRTMAKATGVSKATVQRLWSATAIKPHLVRTFKLSRDPQFEAKFWDVIGLYLDPPDRALVLCCDEKSQRQALERTQPGLPLGIGHIRTKTHDYTHHGTITLFAALCYLDGQIFAHTAPRHTHRQWLAFLKHLDKQTPADLTLHIVIDNYATHKHPKVKSWIAWRNARRGGRDDGRARFALHFTPTSSSWMNLVERFFRDLTEDAVREGSFASV